MMQPPGKCTTRAMAAAKYGPIDLASKFWPEQNTWIKIFVVPEGWFPTWTVLDTREMVRHIACNVDLHIPLRAAMNDLKFKGIGQELRTFDGAFNIRQVRGSNLFSAHSYGLALDFNAATNPLGQIHTDFTPGFIECFTKYGFDWGGNFKNRKDCMHFSWAWE